MPSQEQPGPKKFDVVFRGYAREAVDEYIVRLHEWLVDCESRANNAMQNATTAVGERVSEILKAAFEAGEQARQSSEKEAARLLEQADQRAAELVRFAERRAEHLAEQAEAALKDAEQAKVDAIEKAEAEAQRRLAEAHREYDAVQDSINELASRKSRAVSELSRLQQYLAGAPEVRRAEPVEATPDTESAPANGDQLIVQAAPAAS